MNGFKPMGSWQEGDWIAAIAVFVLAIFLTVGAKVAIQKEPEFAGHPKGLYMLFFAEMWERFSYYGMRALLIFYLTQHWLFNDSKSNLIYGAYTSLVYITPVLGGYLADRYLGQRKAVLFGGVLLAVGHSLMAVEGVGGQSDPTINVFWAALAFIIVGSGFLKANISVMVGQLYKLTDVRRDGAYTVFYMGINLGAAIGTILVGYLGQTIGWGYGFGLAGLGMLAGLVVFVLGKSALRGAGEAPQALAKSKEWTLYAVGIGAVAVIWALVQYQDVIQSLLVISGIALLGYVLYESFKLDKEPRERMFAILFLIALNPLFWGLFEQAGGSMNLFTDRFVDRAGVPASIFQSINPIYIILLAPLFAGLWIKLARTRDGAFSSCQVRARTGSNGIGQPRARVGRRGLRPCGDDARHLRIPLLPPGDHRRTLPFARRPFGNEPACAVVPRFTHHGRLVLHDRGRQFRRRQDRRSHGRAWRRDEQGEAAGDLRDVRLDLDRCSCRRPAPLADRQAVDAPRHVAGSRSASRP